VPCGAAQKLFVGRLVQMTMLVLVMVVLNTLRLKVVSSEPPKTVAGGGDEDRVATRASAHSG
jgi:hypothetical protein